MYLGNGDSRNETRADGGLYRCENIHVQVVNTEEVLLSKSSWSGEIGLAVSIPHTQSETPCFTTKASQVEYWSARYSTMTDADSDDWSCL